MVDGIALLNYHTSCELGAFLAEHAFMDAQGLLRWWKCYWNKVQMSLLTNNHITNLSISNNGTCNDGAFNTCATNKYANNDIAFNECITNDSAFLCVSNKSACNNGMVHQPMGP